MMAIVCLPIGRPIKSGAAAILLLAATGTSGCGLNYKSKLSAPKPVPSIPEFEVQDWLKFAPATDNSARFGDIRVNWNKLVQDGGPVAVQAGDSLYLGATPRSEVTAGFDPTVSPPVLWKASVLRAVASNPSYHVPATAAQRTFSGSLAEGKEYVLSAAIKRGNTWIVNAPKVGVFIYDSRTVTAAATSTAAADLKDAQANVALGSPLRSEQLKVSGRCTFKKGNSGASSIPGDAAYVTLAGIKVSGNYSFENSPPADGVMGTYEGTVTVDASSLPELASNAGNELRWVCKTASGLTDAVVMRMGVDFTPPSVAYTSTPVDGNYRVVIPRNGSGTITLSCGNGFSRVRRLSFKSNSIEFPLQFLTVPESTDCPAGQNAVVNVSVGCTPKVFNSTQTGVYLVQFGAVDTAGNGQDLATYVIDVSPRVCPGDPVSL